MNLSKGLHYLSSVDSKMGKLINEYPPPNFDSDENAFLSLIKYLIYQQLSSKSASAIFNRYKELFKHKDYGNPKDVISIDKNKFKSIGLSKQKIEYIYNVADFFSDNILIDNFLNYSDDHIKDLLIKIKGVGPWTIDMFLMFTLKREDIMPFSDLGIKKGFLKYYDLDYFPTLSFMQRQSQIWSPFRSIASIYLWHLVDDDFKW